MHDNLVFSIDYSRILAGVLNLPPERLPLLLEGSGLTLRQFLEMEGYISWPDQHRIIVNALAMSDTPVLGLIAGERYSLMTHGLVGVAAMASPTVIDALRMQMRFQPTRAQFTRLALEQTRQHLRLSFEITVGQDAVSDFLRDALLVSLISTLRFLVGDKVRDIQVCLSYPEPDYLPLFRQLVPGKISFGQPANQILLPVAFGNLPVATHDLNIQRWAVQQCEQQFQRLQLSTTFTARTLAILRQSPGQPVSQEQLAFMLNVSPRTLLRRLKEEGVTFKHLVDDEQKRLAQYYLEHTDLTAETIAEQVGYHDLSSFRRAFKRWFGLLPSQYPR